VVIGGGNAAIETAMQLVAYCQSVTILEYNPSFKADKISVEKILANPKVKGVINVEIQEFKGDRFVKSVIYKDRVTGKITELVTGGIFVEIGFIPTTDFVKDLVDLTDFGAIKIDHKTQRTSLTGIWAAGDCTNIPYHQNNIAVGDAIKALENIYSYLHIQE